MRNKLAAVAVLIVAALLGALALTGSATAANTVRSSDIVNDTIQSIDVKKNALTGLDVANGSLNGGDLRPGAISETQLSQSVKDKLNASPEPNESYEVDGVYTNVFEGDEGASLQSATVECAEGKYVTGGGFSRADEAPALFKNLQIVTSAPNEDTGYRIKGDPEWSRVATGWKVEGFNNGDTDLIVRPWVICAEFPVPPAHE